MCRGKQVKQRSDSIFRHKKQNVVVTNRNKPGIENELSSSFALPKPLINNKKKKRVVQ